MLEVQVKVFALAHIAKFKLRLKILLLVYFVKGMGQKPELSDTSDEKWEDNGEPEKKPGHHS